MISRYRLEIPIIALTENKKTAEELTISFGVVPVLTKFTNRLFDAEEILRKMIDKKLLEKGDTVIMIHGKNWQKTGLTSAIQLVRYNIALLHR
jgi:pyruvate kinase